MGNPFKLLKPKFNYNGLESGCYYARKRKSGFAIYHQSFSEGKKTDTMVERLAYPELGFKLDWTFEEARERCTILNKEKTLHQTKVREASNRLLQLQSIDELLFNQERVLAFQKRLENDNEGSELHLKKIGSHFLKIQKLCKDLKLLPHEYKDNEKLIYKWFAKNKVSLDYSQKLISLLNRWGTFISRLDGRFFEPVSPAKGISRENIREAHDNAVGIRKESKPITPEMLNSKKDQLSEENYNFLFISVWFGLRPFEIKSLETSTIKYNDQGLKFLIVYQSKLKMLQKSKRFKAIPILFTEQEDALKIIESKKFKAPIYKLMRKVFGEDFGLYAGRKGFTDLMLSKGYMLEDISLWLGHTSIETTWAHYKNKNTLELPNPKKK